MFFNLTLISRYLNVHADALTKKARARGYIFFHVSHNKSIRGVLRGSLLLTRFDLIYGVVNKNIYIPVTDVHTLNFRLDLISYEDYHS